MGLTFRLGQLPLSILTDSSNNIGIGGAANASFKLQVTGTTNLTSALTGTSGVFSSTVQASAYRLTGMTAGSGALYWSSDRVTLANYNASGTVVIETGGGTTALTLAANQAATFSGTITTNTSVAADNNLRVQNSTNAYASAINLIANNDDGARFNFINSSTNGGTIHWQIGGGSVTNTMIFYTNNNAERMRISSGGNVSIGTTNTSARLNIQASANFENATLGTATGTMGYLAANGLYGMYIGIGNSGNTWLQSQRNDGSTDVYSLLLNPSGGNVGIGTSSPNATAANRTVLDLNGSLECLFAFSNGGTLRGYIYHNASTSLYVTEGARNMEFSTTGAGFMGFGTNNTERMRITSGGDVGIGNTAFSSTRLTVTGKSNTGSDYSFVANNASNQNLFLVRNDGIIIAKGVYDYNYASTANVFVQEDGVLGRNSSSLKYKKNIEDYKKGLDYVLKLRPVLYESRNPSENSLKFTGFIAEEVSEIGLTELVYYDNNEPDALHYPHFVALLTKAIQEQQAQIEELKTLINNK